MAISNHSSHLLQVKIDSVLLQDLKHIAGYKGITVASFVKLHLKEISRAEKKRLFTENGLTEDQELEVLQREKEALCFLQQGKIRAKSGRRIIKELNA